MVLGGILLAFLGHGLLQPARGLEVLVALHQVLPLLLALLEEEGLFAALDCLLLLRLQIRLGVSFVSLSS